MSKVLFTMLLLASVVLVMLKGFSALWFIYFCRFILLLSSIIPISLRVNLELAKAFYAYTIQHDPKLSTTVVRNSSIPEELGRIDFLLTDKTGTLTQNEMVFKKLHIGRIQFSAEAVEEIRGHFRSSFDSMPITNISRRRLEVWELLRRTLIGLALCHNVTPVKSELVDEVRQNHRICTTRQSSYVKGAQKRSAVPLPIRRSRTSLRFLLWKKILWFLFSRLRSKLLLLMKSR